MAERTFRVGIFDVEDDTDMPMADAMAQIYARRLVDRVYEEAPKNHRLEAHDVRRNLHFANFVTLGYSGPGRARLSDPVDPIGLSSDEFYTHETAMLYDAENSIAYIESIREGIAPGAIQRYLSEFVESASYRLTMRLDPEASARANRFGIIGALEVGVMIGPATEADRGAGVGAINGFGQRYGASHANLVVKVERSNRDRTLTIPGIRELISRVTGSSYSDRIRKLKLTGRESDDGPSEVIDILHHAEKREQILEVDPTERKIPRPRRWNALERIRNDYASQ